MGKKRKVILRGIVASVIILLAFSGIFLCLLYRDQKAQLMESSEDIDVSLQKTSILSKQLLITDVSWMGLASWVVAEDKGFFQEQGVNVKVVPFSKKYESRYALAEGKIDFVSGDAGDVGVYAGLGYHISIVMVNIWDLRTDSIVIKNKFKDLSDLKGKIIAGDKKAYADFYFLVKALEKHGLSLSDLIIIDMSEEEAMVAFIKGHIDAVMIGKPFASIAAEKGNGRIAMVREEIDKDPIAIYARNEILKENPGTVVKVLKAYFKAVKWSEEYPNEYYEIANRRIFNNTKTYEKLRRAEEAFKILKPREIEKEMKTNGPLFKYCEEIVDYWYNQGTIDSKPDPSSFINNELYLKALEVYE